MKNKHLLALIFGFWVAGTSYSIAADKPHPWVLQIVDEIKKYGQSEACADGRALRKNHQNCATKDGAAIAKIVCTTHDNVYRDKFEKGQCGSKAAKTWGGVEDVGTYFEKAIDLGKPDAIALACTPPLEQLRGKLKEVAEKKCQDGTVKPKAPARPTQAAPMVKPEELKKGAAFMEELKKVLQEGPKLKPVNRRISLGGAGKVTVEGQAISVPATTMPEITTQTKQDLLSASQQLSEALKNLNKSVEGGEGVSQGELPTVEKLTQNIQNAQTEQQVVDVVKKATQEVVQWESSKAKRQRELEAMRQKSNPLLGG
ncbi:hypothetical protein [Candidatus Nucleicultrix amoebiphila]|jgi:hypothetical protein|uniref:Uncharacterized protein n=1 Tax=Candidatus Nucleicultrix amoebiphila FS5 TaxID=1414854 RepID=A0A1W6N489_9PROT|nr:hypothetical protein [Candidatus Nucleicultrix amoebiphila]ARN84581.1 hypothetical protein GQ61_03795 [Candidatus Nucleicultrix amoebiphila FS5]